MTELGGRKARPGYEFVIVDTSWKNIIPLVTIAAPSASSSSGGLGALSRTSAPQPKDTGPKSTPYVVPNLQNLLWLLTDNRYADTVDLEAQAAAPNHLNDGFGIAKFEEVVRGTLVFEAPANAKYRALQFYDNDNGHIQIPLTGTKPAAAATLGPARENEIVQLAVSDAGFGPAGLQTPAGLRHYTVSLRGLSKSPRDIARVPFDRNFFLQNDHGCVSLAEKDVTGLTRPFGSTGLFPPTGPNEGQIAFLVPDDTKRVRVLITASNAASLVLPAGADFSPSWPAPVQTIEDGSTMRVLILPTPARPAGLPEPAAGRQYVVLDVVAENRKPKIGIELDGTQQLRLMDASGGFISPAPVSHRLPCRLGEMGVIPAGHARRFLLVYEVPSGAVPTKLQYRGFEKDQVIAEIRK